MTGTRKTASPYPPRVHAKHGALYYVHANRWTRIARGLAWTAEAAARYSRLVGTRAPRASFAALCEAYQDSVYFAELAPRTREDALVEIAMLGKVFGRMLAAAILPEHVGAYKQKRGKKAKVRCNRELSRLRAILNFGLEAGWCKVNAAAGIRNWKESPRVRLIGAEEFEAFRAFAQQHGEGSRVCLVVMRLAYLTTQRRADVLAIRHADIDHEGIRFQQAKTGRRVLVRWTAALREAVEEARALHPVARLSPYLLVTQRGRVRPYNETGIKALWTRLQVAWAAAGHERFTFHDTRAMGISKLKAAGRQAREISGHLTEATAERIYDRRNESAGDAVE